MTAIGIDLGTTYSCVGIWENNKVSIIANSEGYKTTPSFVSFKDNKRIVGAQAKEEIKSNYKNTIHDVKRLIGRDYSDPSIKYIKKQVGYTIKKKNNNIVVEVEHGDAKKLYTPEEISAMILSSVKKIAENYSGTVIKNAVITVPAYFNDSQRTATKNAGIIAGLNVLRIINEPTAAAMAYGFEKTNKECILVFDLGGGTFDVSILTINDGIYEVKATAGDTELGGENFNESVIKHLVKIYKKKVKKVPDEKTLVMMRIQTEKAKKNLSEFEESLIIIDDFEFNLTRNMFNELNEKYFKTCIDIVANVLMSAKLNRSNIDEVVLVGGSTRIIRVRELLRDYFNKEPNISINPDEAVAYGASIQAALLSGIMDTTGKLDSTLLLDVIPLSLGLETAGGMMTTLLHRNTTVPCIKKQIFSTYSDSQTGVLIKIYEGERGLVKDNNMLSSVKLDGIPPMPRGIPQIEVTYSVDSNGILNVSAMEKSTNTTVKTTITNKQISKKDLDKMIKDSELFNEEDNKVREHIESRNRLECYCYSVRNSILNRLEYQNNIMPLINDVLITIKDKELTTEEYKNRLEILRSSIDDILSKGSRTTKI